MTHKFDKDLDLILNRIMNFVTALLCTLLAWGADAKEVYPKGCVPWPIHEATPSFTGSKPVVLMLHNLAQNDIWVTRPASDQGAQAGFGSLLQVGKWSSLAINLTKISLPLKCIESRPGHEQPISCKDVLAICQWPNTQFPKLDSGIFWAGENMSLAPLQAFLARQGYGLE